MPESLRMASAFDAGVRALLSCDVQRSEPVLRRCEARGVSEPMSSAISEKLLEESAMVMARIQSKS